MYFAGSPWTAGPDGFSFSGAWTNSLGAMAATVATIGALLNDSFLLDRMSRYFKEWLKFGVYPVGADWNQRRWIQNDAQAPIRGYRYALLNVGSHITIADHISRATGTTELFEYETSDGMFGTEGGPKSLKRVMLYYARLTNGTINHYASTTSTSDPGLRFNPCVRSKTTGQLVCNIGFTHLAVPNIYYNDPEIKTAYMQSIPGSYETYGCDSLGGDWCTPYPRIRFLFGQMEGKVWPYSTMGDSLPPSRPTGLKIANP